MIEPGSPHPSPWPGKENWVQIPHRQCERGVSHLDRAPSSPQTLITNLLIHLHALRGHCHKANALEEKHIPLEGRNGPCVRAGSSRRKSPHFTGLLQSPRKLRRLTSELWMTHDLLLSGRTFQIPEAKVRGINNLKCVLQGGLKNE